MQNTIDSINYTTIGSYCNSKSTVALSLNVTHSWFDDIRNFCRNFLFLSLIVSWTWWHSKKCYTLLNDRLIPRRKSLSKTTVDGVVQRSGLVSIYWGRLLKRSLTFLRKSAPRQRKYWLRLWICPPLEKILRAPITYLRTVDCHCDVCLLVQRNMDAASASLLEIPPQLAYVFSKLDGKTATYLLPFLISLFFQLLLVVPHSEDVWETRSFHSL